MKIYLAFQIVWDAKFDLAAMESILQLFPMKFLFDIWKERFRIISGNSETRNRRILTWDFGVVISHWNDLLNSNLQTQ